MSKWELEFELDKNRFTIKYNKPIVVVEGDDEELDQSIKKSVLRNDPSPKLPMQEVNTTTNNDESHKGAKLAKPVDPIKESDYCNMIKMDQRQTIGDLRNKIANELKVDSMRVILKRGGQYGMELKEDDITLK